MGAYFILRSLLDKLSTGHMPLKPSKRHHGTLAVGEILVVRADDACVVRVILYVDVILHVAKDDSDEGVVR